MSARQHLSTRERVRIFETHGGRCHLCGLRIQAGEPWDVSHEIPLAAGGEDVPENRLPAHRKCHRTHTATVDAPRIAKTKRQRAKHIGAVRSRSPLGNSRWKRRLDGTVIDRFTGQEV